MLLPSAPPPAIVSAEAPAVVRYETSAEWHAVLTSRLPVLVRSAPEPPVEYPRENLPLRVEVIADGVRPDGSWYQTIRLTIESGGSLGSASRAIFGNVQHVDELFEAARKLNPGLDRPALVPVGQQIELTVDPARVFVLVSVDVDDRQIVRTFANGVRETIYLEPETSVVRLVLFPATPDGRPFSFPNTDPSAHLGPNEPDRLEVPSGGRLVEYRYKPGEAYENLVSAALGVATSKGAFEISSQTGFSPTHWPPQPGEARRVILGPLASYQPDSATAPEVGPPDPEARPAFDRLQEARRRLGITASRRHASGTLFRVTVEDPAATARDVARLLYGSDEEYLEVARMAGFALPADAAADGRSDNPKLFGTSFEISVDYTREYFPYSDEYDEARRVHVVRLLNGTTIERHDRAQTGGHGVWEITRYPDGSRQVTYRPSGLMMAIGRGLAYVRGIRDVGLDRDVAEARRQQYAADFVWNWSFDAPHEPGDIPDSFAIRSLGTREGGEAEVVVVSIGASAPLAPVVSAFDRLWAYSPLVKVVAVVVAGALVVIAVGLLGRHVGAPGRET